MLITQKLLDSFINALTAEQKDKIYEIAINDLDEAMSLMANLYEKIFCDYPTGFIAAFIQQHLKDKVFQKTFRRDILAA